MKTCRIPYEKVCRTGVRNLSITQRKTCHSVVTATACKSYNFTLNLLFTSEGIMYFCCNYLDKWQQRDVNINVITCYYLNSASHNYLTLVLPRYFYYICYHIGGHYDSPLEIRYYAPHIHRG